MAARTRPDDHVAQARRVDPYRSKTYQRLSKEKDAEKSMRPASEPSGLPLCVVVETFCEELSVRGRGEGEHGGWCQQVGTPATADRCTNHVDSSVPGGGPFWPLPTSIHTSLSLHDPTDGTGE